MKYVTFFTLLYVLLSFQLLPAQAPDTLWTRTFGEGVGNCVIETSDSGFIVVGKKVGDVYLVKTNSMGDSLWSKTFGGAGDDDGESVRQTTDGGYIIAGGLNQLDVLLIKTNELGDTLWTKTYDSGVGRDFAYSVQQTADSGYIVVGGKSQWYLGSQAIWLIKTDDIGDTLWTNAYHSFVGSGYTCGYSVQQTHDGGYIISGELGGGLGGAVAGLIKTNNLGDAIWTKILVGAFSSGFSVQQTIDNGYINTGGSDTYNQDIGNVWLIKTNVLGDTLWTKTFGDTLHEEGHSVQQTSDGGYIITGFTESFGMGLKDIWLLKTDANGDTLWTETYGGSGDDVGHCVQETSDGGYIVVGETNGDIWLIKIAPDPSWIDTDKQTKIPTEFFLSQNYPNPFNPSTTIEFDLPRTSEVRLRVFNILGEEVATLVSARLSTGSYSYDWDASHLASGVYLYRLQAGDYVETRKMVLMR